MAAQNPGGGGRGTSDVAPVEGEDEIPQFLPPDEPLGGYIFMCNEENFARIHELMVFGYPDFYRGNPDACPEHSKPNTFRDRVEAITPGLPLFLYNLTTRRLHGVYEAAGYGGYNIEPRYIPCSHDMRRSSFPLQVRVRWRTEYQPLDEVINSDIMIFLQAIRRNNYYRYCVELSVNVAEFMIEVFDDYSVRVE